MSADFEHLMPHSVALAGHPQGVVLHVVRGGSSSTQGEPLIFIHGAMGDWRSAAPQWTAFAADFDCVSYSRRFSFPNVNPPPAPDHCALHEAFDLRLLLDALKMERAHLVGSSYGGFTALALAVASPERVASVVSVEAPMMKYAYRTQAGAQIAEAFRRDTIEPANAAFRAGDDARGAAIMTGGISGGAISVDSPAMRRRMQNLLAMKSLALSTDEFPLLEPEKLAALPMPVMLVCGGNTAPVHRAIFDNVVAVMPQAQVAVIDGAGHGVARDQPGAFNALVRRFLAGIGSASGATSS